MLLRSATTEEDRAAVLEAIAEEAMERKERALSRAGYLDEREPGAEGVGEKEARRFALAATGKRTPMKELVEDWLAVSQNEPKTKDMKRSTVARFASAFPYVSDATHADVQEWVDGLALKQGLSAKSITRILSELRGYWRYLISKRVVDKGSNPFSDLTIPRVNGGTETQAFTAAQVVDLLETAESSGDLELADLIRLGMWTGCRIESLCKLRVSDVFDQHLRIEDDKTPAGTRDVPIHPKLRRTLKRLVASSTDGFVLPDLPQNKYGDRSNAIGKRFGRMKKAKGFASRVYTFHSIRGTVATLLENAGVPENVAADIIGHEKPTMTYGLYSGGSSLQVKLQAIKKIGYPGYIAR